MRYYKIAIEGGKTYESFVGGQNLPGALQVELDIPVAPFSAPAGAGYVKIWGVGLADIIQSSDNNGKTISVYGGMQKGLPLAKPAQAGLLATGTIVQAFGNWINTEQSLDLIFYADMGTDAKPKNIVVDWQKGDPMAGALQTALQRAFPSAEITINIDPALVAIETQCGFYKTVAQLQQYILAASLSILGPKPTAASTADENRALAYTGVEIFQSDNKFNIYDGSTANTPVDLAFSDLIGQPTWIDTQTVQFKCAMRADLTIDDYVKFPQGVVATTTAPGAAPLGSGLKQKTSFQGAFRINAAHHFGSSRQKDAASWNTTFNAYPAKARAAQPSDQLGRVGK